MDELEIFKIRSEKLKEIANERLTKARLTTPVRGSDLLINQPQIISWGKNKEFDKHKLIRDQRDRGLVLELAICRSEIIPSNVVSMDNEELKISLYEMYRMAGRIKFSGSRVVARELETSIRDDIDEEDRWQQLPVKMMIGNGF